MLRTMDTAHLLDFTTGKELWCTAWHWFQESSIEWSKTLLTDSICSWIQVEKVNQDEDNYYHNLMDGRCQIRLRVLETRSGKEVCDQGIWQFDGEGIHKEHDSGAGPKGVASGKFLCLASTLAFRNTSVACEVDYTEYEGVSAAGIRACNK